MSRFINRHGHAGGGKKTPTYNSWQSMIARCTDPRNKAYANYGGRGIQVCERWMSFDAFLADMKDRPAGKSLDRINNNEGYCPENCRWATATEQHRNTRCDRLISVHGKTLCVADWCDFFGISRKTVSSRLRLGWNEADALFKPLRSHKRQQTA